MKSEQNKARCALGAEMGGSHPLAPTNVVEEDGEDIFTPMPKQCTKWICSKFGRPTLIERNGFMVCPTCGGSYGSVGEPS